MIKLITPKRDLYMDGDTSNPEGLFGKKGVFYEVEKSPHSALDIIFTDERGNSHEYGLDFVDEDFWTVDFDKGFDFKTSLDEDYSFKNNFIVETGIYHNSYMIGIVIGVIKEGGWIITRFSNQTEQPSVEERPFENWKKDIGSAKFIRSTAKSKAIICVVADIKGYLDAKNNLFYYHKNNKGQHTYISCKVEYNPETGWNFVRDNKDSFLVEKAATVLASFSVPIDNKDTGQQGSSKDEGEVSVEEASVWTDKHYDFSYTLTEEDIEAGEIKIDPYFVSYQWKLGEKDNSGALWHCFKGIARFGEKNPVEREIKALHAQVKRLAEIHKVDLR